MSCAWWHGKHPAKRQPRNNPVLWCASLTAHWALSKSCSGVDNSHQDDCTSQKWWGEADGRYQQKTQEKGNVNSNLMLTLKSPWAVCCFSQPAAKPVVLPSSFASWALLGLVLRPACFPCGQEGAAELGRSAERREGWDCCGLAAVLHACAGSGHGSGEHQAVGLAAERRSLWLSKGSKILVAICGFGNLRVNPIGILGTGKGPWAWMKMCYTSCLTGGRPSLAVAWAFFQL